MVFLQYECDGVCLDLPIQQTVYHILHNDVVSHRYEWEDGCIDAPFVQIVYRILYNDKVFLLRESEDDLSELLLLQIVYDIYHTDVVSRQYGCEDVCLDSPWSKISDCIIYTDMYF